MKTKARKFPKSLLDKKARVSEYTTYWRRRRMLNRVQFQYLKSQLDRTVTVWNTDGLATAKALLDHIDLAATYYVLGNIQKGQ